jgi:hypothetical protein
LTRELITTLPSKSISTCSVISVLPICGDIVHLYLIHLWSKVVLALFDGAPSVRAGVGEVVGTMFMGKADDASPLV